MTMRGSKQIVTWQIRPEIVAMVKALAKADGDPAQVAAEKLIVKGLELREKELK